MCQVRGCVEEHKTMLHPTLGVQLERVSTLHSSRESDQQTSAGTGHTSGAHGINQEDQSISAV